MYNVIAYNNNKQGEWNQKGYMVTTKPLDYFLVEFNPELVGTISDFTEKQAVDLASDLTHLEKGGLFDRLKIGTILNRIPTYKESVSVLSDEEAEEWRNSL